MSDIDADLLKFESYALGAASVQTAVKHGEARKVQLSWLTASAGER
jgi:hypothetical protein